MKWLKVVVWICGWLLMWSIAAEPVEASERERELELDPGRSKQGIGWLVEDEGGGRQIRGGQKQMRSWECWRDMEPGKRKRMKSYRRRKKGGKGRQGRRLRYSRSRKRERAEPEAEKERREDEGASVQTEVKKEEAGAESEACLLNEAEWVEAQWGASELGDKRLTKRAVKMGRRMVANPAGSIPDQMEAWGETKGAYRLLNNKKVSLEKLSEGHWQQTRQASQEAEVVLQIQDTSEVDLTSQKHIQGLGPIGNDRGRGFLLHTVLSFVPGGEKVLGLSHQQVVLRQARQGERKKKWMRTPEALVWEKAAQEVGQPEAGRLWVHVGDRGSDIYSFMGLCQEMPGVEFLVRLYSNRLLDWSEQPSAEGNRSEPERHLLDYARKLTRQGPSFEVEVAAQKNQSKRQATVQLAWSQVTIPAPKEAPKAIRRFGSFKAWVVRAWEVNPPEEVSEPLEWVLLSSLPVHNWTDARQRVTWYKHRWLIEEYFKSLKTGCQLEQSQLDHRADFERLLGFLSPIAVRLLQIRQIVRQAPDTAAPDLIHPVPLQLVAREIESDPKIMTVQQFWLGVAQLGGHLGREADGMPGWITIWRGLRKLQLMMRGATLALGLPPGSIPLLLGLDGPKDVGKA